jgi:hypothetical protein
MVETGKVLPLGSGAVTTDVSHDFDVELAEVNEVIRRCELGLKLARECEFSSLVAEITRILRAMHECREVLAPALKRRTQ